MMKIFKIIIILAIISNASAVLGDDSAVSTPEERQKRMGLLREKLRSSNIDNSTEINYVQLATPVDEESI
jgi:hypothetical protein